MNFLEKPLVIPSIIVGIAFLIGFIVVGWGISARGQNNTISVTGSATQNATADESTWAIQLSRTAY